MQTLIRQVAIVSGTALETVIAERIFFQRLPTSFGNTTSAVIFSFIGGQDEVSVPRSQPRVLFKCYGGGDGQPNNTNALDAETVYNAVNNRFHGLRRTVVDEGVLKASWQVIGPQSTHDEIYNADIYVATYEMSIMAA